MEATLKRLLEEIEATKRRVNALEFKVIPEMKEAQTFIQLRLEEMERGRLSASSASKTSDYQRAGVKSDIRGDGQGVSIMPEEILIDTETWGTENFSR